ncbi:MAG: glutamate--tRNA ligase [Halobacteriales archaeon]
MNDDVRGLLEAYALQNAVEHESDADVGAVIGRVMGEEPELRERAEEVSDVAPEVVADVNSLSHEERVERLRDEAPGLLEELEDDDGDEDDGLPELPGVDGDVVMRFAPNPNGPPTIGSARGLVVNDEYVDRYGGELILRFDDTDPVNKPPVAEAYDWYLEDADWLGVDVDDVYRASDRLEIYYDVAERLIESGGAYVCSCTQDEFQALKREGEACPHRERSVEDNLDGWREMHEDAEDVVLRVKTEVDHPNPAIREWVGFRVVDVDAHPHPRVGDDFRVWPMLDFQSAVDDHELGVTHVIRGKDLRDSADRQRYVYDRFGWSYPEVVHWGRVSVEEYGTLSTSSLAAAIRRGDYDGWDDPAVPTVRALRRRGIRPEALRSALLDLGVSETDLEFSMEHVYSENRGLVDGDADRFFLVRDPVAVKVEDAPPSTARPPLHPDVDRGEREIDVEDVVYLERDDLPGVNRRLRLKSLYNVEFKSTKPPIARYLGDDLSLVREGDVDVVHWCSAVEGESVDATLKTPSGDVEGLVESGARDADVDDVVQFERVGFARVESVDPLVAVYAHR